MSFIETLKRTFHGEREKLEAAKQFASRYQIRYPGAASFMGMVVGVISFIIVAIAIVIGYIILSAVSNTATLAAGSAGLTSAQSTQLTSITNSVTGAFVLLTVLPIVLAASLIIAALFLFGAFGGAGGGVERV